MYTIMQIPTSYDFDMLFKQVEKESPRKLNAQEKKTLSFRKIRRETGIAFEFYGWFNGKSTSQRMTKDSVAWVTIPADKLEAAKELGFFEPKR